MSCSLLDRQLSRVRRRLFTSALLTYLAWSWLAALAVAAVWLLLEPYLLPGAPQMQRWIVAGSLASLATVAGVTLAILRRPTPVAAALALDDRFALKERVTTSYTLSPHEANTPAGQALLADVESKLASVRVGDRFPVRVPLLPAMLLLVCALAVVLLGLFWQPTVVASADRENELATAPESKFDIDKQMQRLVAKPKSAKKDEPPTSEELQQIQAEVERFARQPRDTREDVRERIKDATAIEEQIRREQKAQAERVDAFKEQMKQVERLTRKKREGDRQGPAKKAADALARGDLGQLQDELQRLSRQMEKEEQKERLRRKKRDPNTSEEEKKKAEEELNKLDREQNLTQKEREELARQIEEMEDQLKRLSRKKEEKEKELRDMAERGEIDKDQLDRELDQLEKNAEQLAKDEKDIKDLAEQLGECKKCMNEGKSGEAAKKLAKAAEKAGKLSKEGENAALARKLVQVRTVKKALVKALNNQGGPGAGRRPEQKDDNVDHKETRVKGEWDKGKLEAVGHGPFGGFKGPRKPAELKEEIRQAAQEAPAAIDRQRLPPSARKMARGYFEKVRGPDEKKK